MDDLKADFDAAFKDNATDPAIVELRERIEAAAGEGGDIGVAIVTVKRATAHWPAEMEEVEKKHPPKEEKHDEDKSQKAPPPKEPENGKKGFKK